MIQKNKTALQKATDLLARQDQSEKILRQKLIARKYDESEVDEFDKSFPPKEKLKMPGQLFD